MINFVLKTELVNSACNMLRHAAIYKRKSLRPIAFTLGNSTVLTTDDSIVENALDISRVLCNAVYKTSVEDDFIKCSVIVSNKEASFSVLAVDGVEILKTDSDTIFHKVNDVPVTLTVYFRNDCGSFSYQQNVAFLAAHGVDVIKNKITCLASRHTDIKSFAWKTEAVNSYDSRVSLTIESYDATIDEKDLYLDCVNVVIKLFNSLTNDTNFSTKLGVQKPEF